MWVIDRTEIQRSLLRNLSRFGLGGKWVKASQEFCHWFRDSAMSRPASGTSWSFPDDWKLDVGELTYMSSKKVEKEERGYAGWRAFIGQTWATCLIPFKGAERLPQPLMRVCDGQDKGSVTGHSAESSRLSSLGGWETRWGKRQWAETREMG